MTDDHLRQAYARATALRNDPERANCPSPEALLELAGRDGSEERRLRTLDHVMACPDCRQEFELLRAIELGRRDQTSEAVRRIHWRRPLSISLVTALAAGLALVAVLKPNLSLRRESSDVVRGTAAGAALVAPAADTIVTVSSPGQLAFVWRPVTGARRYTLEVLTPEGSVRAMRETTDTTAVIPRSEIGAGELRWGVRSQMDGGELRSTTRRLTVNAR